MQWQPGILGEALRQNLDGNLATKFGIGRAINLAHAAFAEFGGDPVMRDLLLRRHFFSPAVQLTTTLMGGVADSAT